MACGGTGGHIFPAFSVAEELKLRDPNTQIIYVCGKRDIENAIFKIVAGEKIVSMESVPYRGLRSFLIPVFLLKLVKGLYKSLRLLRGEKPDLVVGFGGYTSFPVTFAAWGLGIPTLVHEQNVIPGKANRVLARVVKGVALSFTETRSTLKLKKNFVITGNPIRSAIEKDCCEEALAYFQFSKSKQTLLVLGGSQGAESVNILFLGALKAIPEDLKEKIQVLHLCGKMAAATAEEALRMAGISGRVYSFFERMDLAYSITDLALGRAGATFLAEIRAKQIPAILVPYPSGDGHQLVNARAFCRVHEAVMAEQKDLTSAKLAEMLTIFLNKISKNGRQNHEPEIEEIPNARGLLADFMMEVMKK